MAEGKEAEASSTPVVFVVFYSMYGHIRTMADAVKAGIEEAGCECRLYQVEETLSDEVLEKMHAPPKDDSVPVLEDVRTLTEADGIIFGFPTRFGMLPAQMKALFDKTGGLWMSGGLVGKPASIFTSTGTLGGGQETTMLASIPFLAHQGMMYVPIGYSDQALTNLDELHGGSPYGAGTLAGGDGSRQPSELELGIARHQGKHFSKIAAALKRGSA